MYRPKPRNPRMLKSLAPAAFALALAGCNAAPSPLSPPTSPSGELLAVANDAYIDTGSKSGVLEFASTGTAPVRTITSGPAGKAPSFMTADRAGNLYVIGSTPHYASSTIAEYASGATTPTRMLQGVIDPTAMVSDASGNLFVEDIRASPSGAVLEYTPQATTPSVRIVSGIHSPQRVAEDDATNLYVLNVFGASQRCRETITEYPQGETTPSRSLTVQGCPSRTPMAVDGQHSQVYVVTGGGRRVAIFGDNGTRPKRILKNGIQNAYALAVDNKGYLYVANAPGSYSGSSGGLTVAIFAPRDAAPRRIIHVRNGIGACSGGLQPIDVDSQQNVYLIDCYFAFHHAADTLVYSHAGKRLRTLHGLGDYAQALTIIP